MSRCISGEPWPQRCTEGSRQWRRFLYLIYGHYSITFSLSDSAGKGDFSMDSGHTAKIKIYPSGAYSVLVSRRDIFGGPPVEYDGPRTPGPGAWDPERNRQRAKTMVRDYALSNDDLVWFVTFTLDRAKIDRYDMGVITSALNAWLSNRVERKGLKYILVPERHKDGAVHFHGLLNNALPATFSGVKQKGRKVYNLPDWTYGFSTAIRVYGTREKAIQYTVKYISKTTEKVGGRYYYHGGDLLLPEVQYADFMPEDCGNEFITFDTPIGDMWYAYYPAERSDNE